MAPQNFALLARSFRLIFGEQLARRWLFDRFAPSASFCIWIAIEAGATPKIARSLAANTPSQVDVKFLAAEAIQVSHAIFSAMQEKAGSLRTKFALIILPTTLDLIRFRTDSHYSEFWKAMSKFICKDIEMCIDLALPLRGIPVSEIDYGYDGTHYGPRMSGRIAEAVLSQFLRSGVSNKTRGTAEAYPR